MNYIHFGAENFLEILGDFNWNYLQWWAPKIWANNSEV